MKKLNFKIDKEKLNLSEDEKKIISKMKDNGLFEQTLNQGLSAKFRDGFRAPQQRILSRILNKLDESNDDTIELEEAEFDLVKSVFLDENSSFSPGQTRLIMQYVDAVEFAAKEESSLDK